MDDDRETNESASVETPTEWKVGAIIMASLSALYLLGLFVISFIAK